MGTSWLGPLCALSSSASWAFGSTAYSKLSRNYSPFAVNFGRALIAFPLFLISTFVLAGGMTGGWTQFAQVRFHQVGWFALSMIASYGLGDVLFLWSTRSLGVPGALAIASCYPIWTALLGIVLGDGHALSLIQLFGLLLAVMGVVIVILSAPTPESNPSSDSTQLSTKSWLSDRRNGVLLAIATSVLWALNAFALSRGAENLPVSVCNSIRMLLAMGISATIGFFLAPGCPILLPRHQLRSSLWLFVLEAFGNSIFYFYGITRSPLVVGAILTSLAPVIAVPVAWAFGEERISASRTAGIMGVITGLWFLMR